MVWFPQNSKQISRAICFIYSRLSRLCFVLRRDTINYKDIQLLFFETNVNFSRMSTLTIFILLWTFCLTKLSTSLTCYTWERTLISEMLNRTYLSLYILQLARSWEIWQTLILLCTQFQYFLFPLIIQTFKIMLTQL